ncbi:Hydin, partial [Symbiodinium sp. CCMP2456]
VRMTNPTVLSVAYRWCFALSREKPVEDASNPRTPGTTSQLDSRTSFGGRFQGSVVSLTAHSAVAEDGALNSPVSTSASWASLNTSLGHGDGHNALQDVELSQVFDILPIYGRLEPGETQVATFTYEALRDRSFKAVAVCMVDGGPEYEVALKGTAAPCKYSLDRNDLDFGDIPFTEVRTISL